MDNTVDLQATDLFQELDDANLAEVSGGGLINYTSDINTITLAVSATIDLGNLELMLAS